jgi:cytidyltransferase-like protein
LTEAVVPGRFQPPHVGHASIIDRASQSYETVRIGVTGHAERTAQDPLTCDERMEILDSLYDHATYAIEKPRDPDYIRGQLDEMNDDVVIVTANPETVAFVQDIGYPVEMVPELGRLAFNGERIRRRVRLGLPWRHLVPAAVAPGLDEIGFEVIVDEVVEKE